MLSPCPRWATSTNEIVDVNPLPALLRAVREAAAPSTEELAARARRTGPKPSRGLTLRELGDRYDAARGAAPGTTRAQEVLRWERGGVTPTPEARRLLERALRLREGALDAAATVEPLNSRS